MRLIFLAIFLLSYLSGCSDKKSDQDPYFNDYISMWNSLKKEHGIQAQDFNIRFGEFTIGSEALNFKGVQLAACDSALNQIIIKRDYWNQMSILEREIVILHEIGHCALKRDHENKEYLSYKESLMNEEIINESKYEKFRELYILELVTGDKSKLKERIYSYIKEKLEKNNQDTSNLELP